MQGSSDAQTPRYLVRIQFHSLYESVDRQKYLQELVSRRTYLELIERETTAEALLLVVLHRHATDNGPESSTSGTRSNSSGLGSTGCKRNDQEK